MASNVSDTSTSDADRANEAQNQILLKALQDFMVPLLLSVGQTRQIDSNQISLGPEGKKLIAALQEFISSIVVRPQLKAQNGIVVEVGLIQDTSGVQEDIGNEGEAREPSSEVRSLPEPSPSEPGDVIGSSISQNQDSLEQAEPTFHHKLHSALREHVFNMMPVRLLSFEPRGPAGLHITLLERGAIYARLVSALVSNTQETKPRPIKASISEMETEQDAITRLISKYARYAILSHTWLRTSSEVSYGHWNEGIFNARDPGYMKLVNFCKTAWKEHGLAFGWMDTVCINKESSSELDESIRSMYNWYSRASVCITYLADTKTISNMHIDPWFTRGWTLQELLAPDVVKFYKSDWTQLAENSSSDNDKQDGTIAAQIERATTISKDELHNIHTAPISRRMQLAASREVTREEDTAYSLMGIFNVSFSTAYGEGAQRAFFRLLQEILVSSTYYVLDLFNWAGEPPLIRPHISRILPSSPVYYCRRSSHEGLSLGRPIEPLTLTHLGLRVPVILMPAVSILDRTSQYNPIGDYTAIVLMEPVGYYTSVPTTYNLLDSRVSGRDGHRRGPNHSFQITFAVFNMDADATRIRIPRTCMAMALLCSQDAGKVSVLGDINTIETKSPITFELGKRSGTNRNFDPNDDDVDALYTLSYGVKPDRLIRHGMQLVSLYL